VLLGPRSERGLAREALRGVEEIGTSRRDTAERGDSLSVFFLVLTARIRKRRPTGFLGSSFGDGGGGGAWTGGAWRAVVNRAEW
jgi:hypothetical protein